MLLADNLHWLPRIDHRVRLAQASLRVDSHNPHEVSPAFGFRHVGGSRDSEFESEGIKLLTPRPESSTAARQDATFGPLLADLSRSSDWLT